MAFTVACAQFAPQKAEVEANLDRIAEIARQAAAEGADLVLFPEASTTGYFLEGGVAESARTAEQIRTGLDRRLSGLKRPLDLALGFYEEANGTLYNSAAYLEIVSSGVALHHVYRKFFLATYGVFDEERFVARGRDLGVFDSRFGTFALLICEDVWHSILPVLAAVRGAQVMLVPSASPARGFAREQPENLLRYERLLRGISEEHGVYCVNSMLTGFEGGKGFVGGSMVIDPLGTTVVQAPAQEEHLLLAEIDLDLVGIARAQTPLIADLRTVWADVQRLV